jgi:hypothetical protein
MSIEQLQNAWRRAKNANAKERTMEKALTRWCKELYQQPLSKTWS